MFLLFLLCLDLPAQGGCSPRPLHMVTNLPLRESNCSYLLKLIVFIFSVMNSQYTPRPNTPTLCLPCRTVYELHPKKYLCIAIAFRSRTAPLRHFDYRTPGQFSLFTFSVFTFQEQIATYPWLQWQNIWRPFSADMESIIGASYPAKAPIRWHEC